MLRVFITRALLVALPFVVWFAWREIARRTGRDVGATPWTWLVAAGLVLMALSLMATVLFHEDNRGRTYVPAQAEPDGHVRPSEFDARPLPPTSERAPNTSP